MTAPSIEKLLAYLPHKLLSADGQALPSIAVSNPSSVATIYASGLGLATGTLNGATGFFTYASATVALRGVFFHVKSQVTNWVTVAENLPAVPVGGDYFKVFIGGLCRSDQEAFGMTLDGKQPEVITNIYQNIPGLQYLKISPTVGLGTLELAFVTGSPNTMKIRMNGGSWGATVNVTSGGTPVVYTLFTAGGAGWIRVAFSAGASTATDTWTVANPVGTFTPDFEPYERAAGTGGKLRYRQEIVKNTDPLNTMVDLRVFSDKPAGAATTIAGGSGAFTVAAGTMTVTDATGFPTEGFWVKNPTKNDCKYILSRSGNVLSYAKVEWMRMQVTVGSASILRGTLLGKVGDTSKTAVVYDLTLDPYSNMLDLLCFKAAAGWTTGNMTFYSSGAWQAMTPYHTLSSLEYGLRDHHAVAWVAGDAIELMSDVDLKASLPDDQFTPIFASPAGESLAPGSDILAVPGTTDERKARLTYAHAATQGAAIALGDLRPAEVVGVIRREWIVDDARPRALDLDTNYSWS